MTDISKEIGIPAALEQCAEECAELGQACLKLARYLRGENPTPMKKFDILMHLNDEVADVKLCIETLFKAGVIDRGEVNKIRIEKSARWEERLKEFKEGN